MLGPFFIVLFYMLMVAHVEVFLTVIIKVLYMRIGVKLAMVWLVVGAVIGFNVCFNHFLAFTIKANGPKELILIEQLRLKYKNRIGRKELVESDRYVGLS